MLIYIKDKIKNYWFNLDRIDKFVVFLVLFSFIIRIIHLLYFPLRGWDETVYLNLGKDLSNNPLVYSLVNSSWTDFIPSNDIVYGWPNIGFRAPLLPYLFTFLYFLNLDFLIPFVIPVFATISVFLVYILGKELFDKKVGLYSAVLFSLIPIHLYCSERIWSDAFVLFFILLTFISFWKGYEKDNKKHKILFGLFFALSLLSRYTAMWLAPIFLLFFIFRDKSLSFLRNKYLWYSIILFFIVLIPWFMYGFIYYGNPLGSFIHGFKASTYYGGVQSWNYFFVNFWRIFSIIGIIFTFSIIHIFIKKIYFKREVYLLIIWTIFFLFMACIMPHKEDRYILTIVPALCILSGLFISKIGRYKNIVFSITIIVLLISLFNAYKLDYLVSLNKSNICFSDGNDFLVSDTIEDDSLIMTNLSPVVHYYTGKQIILYPNELNAESIRDVIDSKYNNKEIYIFFTNYEMPEGNDFKNDLDNNFDKVFECSKDYGYSVIYKYE